MIYKNRQYKVKMPFTEIKEKFGYAVAHSSYFRGNLIGQSRFRLTSKMRHTEISRRIEDGDFQLKGNLKAKGKEVTLISMRCRARMGVEIGFYASLLGNLIFLLLTIIGNVYPEALNRKGDDSSLIFVVGLSAIIAFFIGIHRFLLKKEVVTEFEKLIKAI